MSRTRGSSLIYKLSCAELGVPAGVVIGRRGSTINLIKSIARVQIRIRDNVIEIKGGHREVITAKGLLTRLKDNYSKGIIGLNMSQPTRKPRRKIHVKTNTATGWSSLEANREAGSKSSTEPVKVNHATKNSFAGLDFDSDTDSDDSHAEEQTAAAVEVKEEFPALPSSPAIKLNIREKETVKPKSWADMCDESDDESDDEC